jgi:hypothetical protein
MDEKIASTVADLLKDPSRQVDIKAIQVGSDDESLEMVHYIALYLTKFKYKKFNQVKKRLNLTEINGVDYAVVILDEDLSFSFPFSL